MSPASVMPNYITNSTLIEFRECSKKVFPFTEIDSKAQSGINSGDTVDSRTVYGEFTCSTTRLAKLCTTLSIQKTTANLNGRNPS